jgi:hypothetical protein
MNKSQTSMKQESGSGADHASIISSLTAAISEGLRGSIDSIKEKLAENMDKNGEAYLQQAVDGVTEATGKLVEWSRQHPVKTAMAGAALMAVTAAIYNTMQSGGTKGGKSSSSGKNEGSAKNSRSTSGSSKSGRSSTAKSRE